MHLLLQAAQQAMAACSVGPRRSSLSKACQAAAAEQQLGLAVRLLQSQGLGLLIKDKETACHLLKVCTLPKPVRKYCTLSWLLPNSSRAALGGGCAPAAGREFGPADKGQRETAYHLLQVVASLSKLSAVASGPSFLLRPLCMPCKPFPSCWLVSAEVQHR